MGQAATLGRFSSRLRGLGGRFSQLNQRVAEAGLAAFLGERQAFDRAAQPGRLKS